MQSEQNLTVMLCAALQEPQIHSLSKSERRASLLPLAQLAVLWLLLIYPQASVSKSLIWTRIKRPNTNSCAEISHVSIYSYFVNHCNCTLCSDSMLQNLN